MKIIYIAHPISGKIKENLEKVRQIVRELNLKRNDIVPFAPYWLDCHALDDNNYKERERGINNNKAFFDKGVIDEVWLFGNQISRGMKAEIDLAKKLNIPVKAMSKEKKMNMELFDTDKDKIEIKNTCKDCEHRQRWQCNSVVVQYCGVRKSNRTDNGLLKIKCKDKACPLFKPIKIK